MSGGRKTHTERTVLGRALAVLDSFSPDHPSLRLVEISRSAGLPLSTVVRILGQLCEWQALERTTDLRYRIGPRLGELAAVRDLSSEPVDRDRGTRDGPRPSLITNGHPIVE